MIHQWASTFIQSRSKDCGKDTNVQALAACNKTKLETFLYFKVERNRMFTVSLSGWPASTPENAIMFWTCFLSVIAHQAEINISDNSPCLWLRRAISYSFKLFHSSKIWWAHELHHLHLNIPPQSIRCSSRYDEMPNKKLLMCLFELNIPREVLFLEAGENQEYSNGSGRHSCAITWYGPQYFCSARFILSTLHLTESTL